jgi:cell division protein FtsB
MTNRVTACALACGVLLVVGGAYMLVPSYTEYRKTRHELQEAKLRLLEQQRLNQQVRNEADLLQVDPVMIERIARDKFNYARPGETVYDFSPPPKPAKP